MENVFTGMVVAVRAFHLGAAIWHVGIVDRNGWVVSNRPQVGVVRELLDDFGERQTNEIVGYCFADSLDATFRRLDNLNCRRTYSPLTWNCEHFLFWALGRQPHSPQRIRATNNGLAGAGLASLGALALGAGPLGVLGALLAGGAAPQYLSNIPSLAQFYRDLGIVRGHQVIEFDGRVLAAVA